MQNPAQKSRIQLFIIIILVLAVSLFFNIYNFIQTRKISSQSIGIAQQIIGLKFTADERSQMVKSLEGEVKKYNSVREMNIENSVAPAIDFNCVPPGFEIRPRKAEMVLSQRSPVVLPENIDELAFWTLPDLALLIRTRQITSTRLTMFYIARLKKYGPPLKCVITLTEELALKQAAQADKEINSGKYRGPLHGIPYGVKDLLSVPEYKTTWGAAPYKEQIIEDKGRVVELLEEAGAVLLAKLSMGALAMGDVWFGGKTVNPWDSTQGSSGSSAGSASATSAGLVGFSIGTETWGSIVSPSTRCRVTGLRPTYGRVSRAGAMALSWTMDKIGPICRSAEGCALVFDAINGADPNDRSTRDVAFEYNGRESISKLRIGFMKTAFEKDSVNVKKYNSIIESLSNAGASLFPIELPEFPVSSLSYILSVEAAAAFDELTRSNRDDLLVRQGSGAWPGNFRKSRFIPAVEYIQANRARLMLMEKMAETMKDVDVFVTPSFGGSQLLLTNLTGHPAVVVPVGENEKGNSMSITFVGQLFEDGKVLQVARAFQKKTRYHLEHPVLEEK